MAIVKKSDDGKKITLEIDNGDLEALKEIEKEWGFSNEANVFRFGLAILTKAKEQTVYVDEDGAKKPLSPADSLLKKTENKDAKEKQ